MSTKSERSKSVSKPKQRSKGSKSRSPKSSRLTQPVIGLDLSLTATGLVVWDGESILRRRRYKTYPYSPADGLKMAPSGQVAPDRFKGDEDERIEWLRRKVKANVRKFQPNLCVIEGHAFGAQGRAKTVLSELAGVIKNQLLRTDVLYVVLAPTSLKKYATGNGKASKFEMIVEAKKFDRTLGTDDEADALHLARWGAENYHELVDD